MVDGLKNGDGWMELWWCVWCGGREGCGEVGGGVKLGIRNSKV